MIRPCGPLTKAAGYQAEVFANGEEAERHLNSRRRPGGQRCAHARPGGLELLKRFQYSVHRDQRFCDSAEAVEAMKIGAYDFVVKPFSYRELIPLVSAV
jgi:DNA-binding NtrC family response regulator